MMPPSSGPTSATRRSASRKSIYLPSCPKTQSSGARHSRRARLRVRISQLPDLGRVSRGLHGLERRGAGGMLFRISGSPGAWPPVLQPRRAGADWPRSRLLHSGRSPAFSIAAIASCHYGKQPPRIPSRRLLLLHQYFHVISVSLSQSFSSS